MDLIPPDAPAAAKVKTSLLSLPDEVLQHVVDLLAGEIIFDITSCKRDGISNGDLPRLRLVNRRLSGIVRAELYRMPNALTDTRGPFSGDDLDILNYPGIAQSAQMLNLVGTSRFLASVIEASRFCRLASLTLVFGDPQTERAPGPDILRSKSLARLREALQPLPLVELRIYYQLDLVLSEYDLFQSALLGAGHATLRTFSILGQHDTDLDSSPAHLKHLMLPTSYTSHLASIAVQSLSADHVYIVRMALGHLPGLEQVSLHTCEKDNQVAATLDALTFGVNHRISRLTLALSTRSTGPLTWQALASLPDLQQLSLTTSRLPRQEHLRCLPKLACLTTAGWGLSIELNLFKSAASCQLFPSLQQIHLPWAMDAGRVLGHAAGHRALIAAYDGLLEARGDVRVTPKTFRELIMENLRALEILE